MQRYTFHPGETIVLNFTLPFSVYDVKAVALTFRDATHIVFETLAESVVSVENDLDPIRTVNGNPEAHTIVGFSLTQEETLLFNEFSKYKMQLNVFSYNGSRSTSQEFDVWTEAQQLTTADYTSVSAPETVSRATTISGGDVTDYTTLTNKPSINGFVLNGQITLYETISNEQIDAAILANLGGET